MAGGRRFLNILFIPHSRSRVVSRRISYRGLKALGVLSVLFLVLVIYLAFHYGQVYFKALRVELLEKRNSELEAEHKKIERLERELILLKEESAKVKSMLGIEEAPPMADLSTLLASVPEDTGVGGEEPSPSSVRRSPEMASVFREQDRLLRAIPSLWPVKGWVSQTYSPSHPALDIAAPLGAPVLAPADGIISFSGWADDLGNLMKIDHGEGFCTVYGHCSRILVSVGDAVRRGEVVGFVGSTGQSTAPHLHYEVRVDGRTVNPQGYLFW